jgi:hypothetical protein
MNNMLTHIIIVSKVYLIAICSNVHTSCCGLFCLKQTFVIRLQTEIGKIAAAAASWKEMCITLVVLVD